jgi:hypothetical protein
MKYLIITLLFGCVETTGFRVVTIKSGKGATSIESADFNRDGHPDLAVANEQDGTVTILLNVGDAGFKPAPGSPFFANQNPNDICIADVDNDGNPDLCIANTEVSMLTLLLGNGRGQFRQAPTSPYRVHSRPHTHGITVADFNGDGKPDMATDSWGDNEVLIIFGDTGLHFGHETHYPVGHRPYQRLRSGDVNGDGKADIVTTNLEGNTVSVLLGSGDGTFRSKEYPAGEAPFGVAIGDVNGDGFPDLAVVDAPSVTAESKGKDGLWILLGDGRGGFHEMVGSPFATGTGPTRVAIGDLDGDKIDDIAVTNYKDNTITIFYMGTKGVKRTKTLRVGNHPDGICIKDLNGDGKNDIAVGNQDDGTVTLLLQQ